MCGIAGILKSPGKIVEELELLSMSSTLAHRGPDGTGTLIDLNVGLAHRRLSIIDLAGGKQPMSTGDGSLWITFNGEIFNYIELREELRRRGHRFRTQSDTEVILHLYREFGEECVHHLNGQWAFAIWDKRERKLFLSRDRMGVRPLFYAQNDSVFYFASEIKAIFANQGVSREIDLRGLDQIFTFWVTIPPQTVFRDIKQLPPGYSLSLKNGQVSVRCYWQPTYTIDEAEPDRAEQKAEELLALLSDAVRIRLRADVPVGAYLSGGIDSTFTTALAKQHALGQLRTFSVGFADPLFDETPFQDEASRFLQTEHSRIQCGTIDIAGVFEDVVRFTEQPILRTAPAPLFLLSKLVRDSGFKVVVTGEGSDELLGGYDVFKEEKVRRFWARQPKSKIRPLLLRRLYPYLDGIQRQPEAYLRNFFRICDEDLRSPFFSHLPRWQLTSKIKLFFSDECKSELAQADVVEGLSEELPQAFTNWPTFCQSQFLETKYLLPGYILSSQGDRMAMAHSVEARYPFLDHRVVDFASRLHPSTKMRVLDEKYLLKCAAQGKIPESILQRHKQPYRSPDGQSFFAGSRQDYVSELLSPACVRRAGIFNPLSVEKLTAKFAYGRTVSTVDDMALVGILSTQLVVHQFVD